MRIATGQPVDTANSAKDFFIYAQKENIKLFIPTIVAAECCWVLKGVYKFNRFMIRDGLIKLFSLPFLELEDKAILQSLDVYAEKNIDFIDAYIASIKKDIPIVTWNGRHFKRLSREFYSPEEILDSEN